VQSSVKEPKKILTQDEKNSHSILVTTSNAPIPIAITRVKITLVPPSLPVIVVPIVPVPSFMNCPPISDITKSISVALRASAVHASVAGIVTIDELGALLIVTIEVSPALAVSVSTALSKSIGRKDNQQRHAEQRSH